MTEEDNMKVLESVERKYDNIKKYMRNIEFKMERLHPGVIRTSTNPYTGIYLRRLNVLLTNVEDSFAKKNPLTGAAHDKWANHPTNHSK